MDTKALKKQMGAAIAMVLVAAVALGSATFAWFMNNNKVTAQTSNISAQSNAPFLKIDKTAISKTSETSIKFDDASTDPDKALYPAQIVKSSDSSSNDPVVVSAYASDVDSATELQGSRYSVGSLQEAVNAEFAVEKSFVIGTADEKAGSFINLKVDKVTVAAKDSQKADLTGAIRVLLVGTDGWAVYKAGNDADSVLVSTYEDGSTAVNATATDGVLVNKIGAGKSTQLKAYLFYDGSQISVTTEKLDVLKECNLNIEFTATPQNTQQTANSAN